MTQKAFYTQHSFAHGKRLHTPICYTLQAFTHREACTHGKHLHTAMFCTDVVTQQALHREALHTARFYTEKPLHAANFETERRRYAEKFLHREAFKDRCVCTRKLLHKEALSHRTLCELVCARHVPVLLCTTKLWQAVSQKYFVITTLLAQNASQNYFVLQDLHRALPSILPCNTKFTKRTSLYYFVLHRPQQVLPSTTSYYKACAKNFPELLSSTKLAQNTSQNCFVRESSDKALLLCFVLQNLHKVLPSTAFYYRGRHRYSLYCTGCTSTTQKYFVLHDLRKPLPSTTLHNKARNNTTLYYKACTKHFPLLLCTTKSCTNHFYAQQSFTLRTLLHREAFTQGTCYTQQAFTHRELSHTASFFTQ